MRSALQSMNNGTLKIGLSWLDSKLRYNSIRSVSLLYSDSVYVQTTKTIHSLGYDITTYHHLPLKWRLSICVLSSQRLWRTLMPPCKLGTAAPVLFHSRDVLFSLLPMNNAIATSADSVERLSTRHGFLTHPCQRTGTTPYSRRCI